MYISVNTSMVTPSITGINISILRNMYFIIDCSYNVFLLNL